MKQFELTDLVCAPTRVTANSSTQIDVFMTADSHCFNLQESILLVVVITM